MPLVALLAPMSGPVLEGKHLYARMCIDRGARGLGASSYQVGSCIHTVLLYFLLFSFSGSLSSPTEAAATGLQRIACLWVTLECCRLLRFARSSLASRREHVNIDR